MNRNGVAVQHRNNLVLVGMPGSGKSTVGVLLAKSLALGFVDTDLLIQQSEGRTLQAIVDTEGYQALRRIEERVLCEVSGGHRVISTGGSAVYSERAMAHLSALGEVVFLEVTLPTLRQRLGDFSLRGISKPPEQSLEALLDERNHLYRRYADLTIVSDGRSQHEVCEAIVAGLPEKWRTS